MSAEVSRRIEQGQEELQYPTVQEFDSMHWLNETHRFFFAFHKKDRPQEAQKPVSDMIFSLQLGYNPGVPLCRVSEFKNGHANAWFLTHRGWLREQIPIPTPVVAEQMREYFLDTTLRDRTVAELIDEPADMQLREKGYAGIGGDVTEEEMNGFIRKLIDETWEDHKIGRRMTEDDPEERQIFNDSMYLEEESPEDRLHAEINHIFKFKGHSSGDEIETFRINADPPVVIARQSQNRETIAIAIPEYHTMQPVNSPNAVNYYTLKEGVLQKKTTLHDPEDTSALEPEQTQPVIASLWNGDDTDDVSRQEAHFVAEYLAEIGNTTRELRTVLEWARTQPYIMSKNLKTPKSSYRLSMKTATFDQHAVAAHLVEERDNTARSSKNSLQKYVYLTLYFTGSHVGENDAFALIAVYHPKEDLLQLMSQGYDQMDPDTLLSEADKIRRYSANSSASQILDNSFPYDSKLKTRTHTLYPMPRLTPSLREISRRIRAQRRS